MDTLNVILATPASEEAKQAIKAVSPIINLIDVSDLSRRDYQGDLQARKELNDILAEAEISYGMRIPTNLLERAPKLKWIQVTSAGVDRYLNDEFRHSSIILTNASGVHATPIGEFVVSLMLMFAKNAVTFFEAKQKKQWTRTAGTVLNGKTVGVVGLGSIGQEVARLCKAFRMRVIATRRSPTKRTARNVDLLLPPNGLPRLLEESDYVALCVPLTPETRNLMSTAEFKMMKPGAYIINIGRGPVIDEAALIHALQEKQIAGAGLDVFTVEPLPLESKLWDMPNVIISPHVSGGREDYEVGALDIFCRNLHRYIEGKRLINVVNKEKGY